MLAAGVTESQGEPTENRSLNLERHVGHMEQDSSDSVKSSRTRFKPQDFADHFLGSWRCHSVLH